VFALQQMVPLVCLEQDFVQKLTYYAVCVLEGDLP
jgi:hypothetical protein